MWLDSQLWPEAVRHGKAVDNVCRFVFFLPGRQSVADRQRQAIRGSLSGYVVQAARQPEGRCRHLGPDWLKHTMARLKQYELTLIQFSSSSCFTFMFQRASLVPMPFAWSVQVGRSVADF